MADLQVFAEKIWIADGPRVRDMGTMFPTRMTIVKLSDGSLWVESPVPSSSETLQQIGELGPVRYLVAATPRHVWRLNEWHTLFSPSATLGVSAHADDTTARTSTIHWHADGHLSGKLGQ